MGNTIFFLFILFAFFLVMELVMLGAFQLSKATKAKKVIGIMCRAFLGLFIIGYLAWAETNVVSGNEVISVSDLAQGNMVAITLVSGAGDITDVFKIQLLQ